MYGRQRSKPLQIEGSRVSISSVPYAPASRLRIIMSRLLHYPQTE